MSAIHLLRAGQPVSAVAQQLGRSERWVRKWWQRYQTAQWAGLADQSRAPHRVPRALSAKVRQQIILVRSTLEAQAATGAALKYIGAPAIRTRLKAQGCQPLPSIASIERVLQAAGLTRPRQSAVQAEVVYPHLQPTAPQQLCQVDIVPHYLTGGTRMPCFNAIDVVSRCATGLAYESVGPKTRVPSPCRSGKPWASPATPSSITIAALMGAIRIRMCWGRWCV